MSPQPLPQSPEGRFASPEDRRLAQAIERGETDAVARVRRWVRAAAGPFRARVGPDLEDLEQEVLLSLTRALRDGSFEGRSTLYTYVRKAVVYRCLNRVRDRGQRELVALEGVSLLAPGPDPHREAAGREELERALEVLSRMSEECRDLWRLLDEGLTYGEMSDRLGVAAGTLRVRMLRCRRRALELWERDIGAPR